MTGVDLAVVGDEEPPPPVSLGPASSAPRPLLTSAALARGFSAVLAVAELLYVLDVLTDGAVRAAVEPSARRIRSQLLAFVRREREWQRARAWVVWEAIEIAREEAERGDRA